jgi:trimeric autotransporter adhesin
MVDVVTQTKPIPRNQLSEITDNPRALRVLEGLAQDVGDTLPKKANETSALVDAQAAQIAAQAAQIAAQAAQIAAQNAIIGAQQVQIDAQTASISALTGQVAGKAPINNPTFTGTVSGITKAMVGLDSVDNTSDANKPVSTAQAAAIALKASLAGATFTGAVALTGGSSLLATTAALTNGAGASLGTITNAPTAGNPTKWIPFNDGGTIRHYPSW